METRLLIGGEQGGRGRPRARHQDRA